MELTGATWRKSTRSGNSECVEVADDLPGVVGARQQGPDRSRPHLPPPGLAVVRHRHRQGCRHPTDPSRPDEGSRLRRRPAEARR